jgi:hypothetical protein
MIVVVSGVPRSGTSLLMQMLAAGGLSVLTDGERKADADNPRGYYEWEPVKRLAREPQAIAQAEGKAVKVISSLLRTLPSDREYKVLFLHRPMEEVVASQAAMIRRLGAAPSALSASAMAAALNAHLKQVEAWVARQTHMAASMIAFHDLIGAPGRESERMKAFLELDLDAAAMSAQVDPALHRQRGGC